MQTSRAHLLGILWMVVSVGAFALMHAVVKSLTPLYPAVQLAALRGLTSLPLVVAWVLLSGATARVFRVRWGLQLARGLLSLLTGLMAIVALRVLPLSDAYSISFAAPLIVTALSVPLLRERVDLLRWLAVIIGFAGVLLVLRPSGLDIFTVGGIAMLVSAIGYALAVIATRTLARTDATTSTVLWTILVHCIGAGVLAIPGWLPIKSEHWPHLIAIGVLGAFGQYAVTEALRRAPASVIAPFEYTGLAWGLALDWWVWGARPTGVMLTGSGVIIVCGLYLISRERWTKSGADGAR